jgi:CRISPR-associated protein Csx17
MNILPLPGCAPTPLAHYLKALGILRLLHEQLPPDLPRPRGAWQGESFVLHSPLDRAGLEHFFLHDYRPTPILAPWNGGSGFYFREEKLNEIDPETGKKRKTGNRNEETTATRTISELIKSTEPRLKELRDFAAFTRRYLTDCGLNARPADEGKIELVRGIRAAAPEKILPWIDAALVITNDRLGMPPHLGSGGCDGNLDFSSSFVRHASRLVDRHGGISAADAELLLKGSLFGETCAGLESAKVGQFDPFSAGANNGGTGFSSSSALNPWDFVLMLEGAVLFASAAVRRMSSETDSVASMPFVVAPTGGGYGAASRADTKRPKSVKRNLYEMWLPVWDRPASVAELAHVFSEGRASVKRKPAADGFGFSRAVAELGVDRGIAAFQRFSFQPRNGDAFFAVPLDRVPVRRRPRLTALLDDLDDLDKSNWLDRVRSAARQNRDDKRAPVPKSVASAVRQLEEAALALLRSSQQEADEQAAVESLLLAVADTEAALARSRTWTKGKGLPPVPRLSGQWWESLRHTTEPELDLAAGLASLGPPSLRLHWEHLDLEKHYPPWNPNSREVCWQDAQFEETLLAVQLRRILYAEDHPSAFAAGYFVQPASIASFLDGETDDLRLARLARALSLVQLSAGAALAASPGGENYEAACAKLPALYALPKLALAGRAPDSGDDMPRLAAILRRGASGDGLAATRLASQRLRASGFTPALREVPACGPAVRRALAATLFPLSPAALDALANTLRPLTLSY